MEKTIVIDGKNITFKSTGGTLYRYKNQFGREYIADAMILSEFQQSKRIEKIKTADGKTAEHEIYDYTKLNLELAYNLIWTLAKTADDSIPDPQSWLDSFDTFPVMDILPMVLELFSKSSAIDSKN